MSDSVWRSFLGASGEDSTENELALLRSAREDAKAAREDAKVKSHQVELMTAMLHAAEEELKLRSSQLELTNAMLHATEAELARKDEQLDLTTQMLKKAEETISKAESERRSLQQQLAAMRDSFNHMADAASESRAVMSNQAAPRSMATHLPPRQQPPTASAGGVSLRDAVDAAGQCRRAALTEAAAASKLAASLAAGTEPVSLAKRPDIIDPQAARVVLMHGDGADTMRPKETAPDLRRDVLRDVRASVARQRNLSS